MLTIYPKGIYYPHKHISKTDMQGVTDMDYNTSFRTTLRDDERNEIKRIANEKGMKLTGFVDYILRRAIAEERDKAGRRA